MNYHCGSLHIDVNRKFPSLIANLIVDYDYMSFLVSSVDYDHSNCNRIRLTITITPRLTTCPEFVYVTINLINVYVSNCWLNRLNVWLLFILWFFHAKRADCIKLLYEINLLK